MSNQQKLHKKIIIPFIVLTSIVTLIFCSFFTIHISKIFNEKETKLTEKSFSLIKSELNNSIQSNTLIYNNIVPDYSISPQLQSYLIGNTTLNQFNVYSSKTIPFYISKQLTTIPINTKNQDIILYKNNNKNYLSIIQQHHSEFEMTTIELSLNNTLNAISLPNKFNVAIILKTKNNKYDIIYSDKNIANLEYKQAISELEKQIQPTNSSINKNIKVNTIGGFSNLHSIIYTTSSSHTETLLTLIGGLILIIILFGLIIAIVYSIIIKRITTSIEILGNVSKKVAKGDFEQKVYIDRKDEIGRLAESFNSMITQLKNSTETTINQKEQLEAIITCVPDGIIVTDLFNNLILANKQAESIFNIKFTQLTGKNLIIHLKNEQFQFHCDQLQKETHVTSEFSLTNKDSISYYSMTSTQVKNTDNKSIGIIYLLRNITIEKQINELQDGFLRTVSHELRTPLTSVIGFIELVLHSSKNDIPEDKKQFLSTAHKEASNLKTLINDLLDLSQIQAGNSKMFYKKINIKQLIESVITSLTPLTKSKNLNLIQKDIQKSLSMQGDESKVRRILINLISNSIKFTEKGHISVGCVDKDTHIEFEVEDSGIGIDKNKHDLIFEKFRQVDYSSTRQYDGIGLGLSIVKELVEMHHGSIEIESELGKGSTFRFTLKK
jgi:two-component system phosphate regulon sensor histidine kinase PhoR